MYCHEWFDLSITVLLEGPGLSSSTALLDNTEAPSEFKRSFAESLAKVLAAMLILGLTSAGMTSKDTLLTIAEFGVRSEVG